MLKYYKPLQSSNVLSQDSEALLDLQVVVYLVAAIVLTHPLKLVSAPW